MESESSKAPTQQASSERLFGARQDQRWGFINISGDFVIEPKFVEISGFAEGLAAVKIGINYGYIDKTGDYVIEPRCVDWAGNFKNGRAPIREAGIFKRRWGFIDKTGNYVIEPQYKRITFFNEGLCGAQVDDKWGFIDEMGNWVIEPLFDEVDSFNEGLAIVYLGKKYGFVDRSGTIIIQPKYIKPERSRLF